MNAEGRHYLSTTRRAIRHHSAFGSRFLQRHPWAAHVFSENYLYTAEAFDLYLSRLSDHGVLNMMRLEHSPAREMLRALTTAVGALRRIGITDPKEHIVTVSENTGFFTAMLVKRTPVLRGRDRKAESDGRSQRPSFGMSAEPASSKSEIKNAYQDFLALDDERLERRFIESYPFAIDPAVDDRPFFFNFSFWWHLLPGQRLFPDQPPSWTDVPVLQLSLAGPGRGGVPGHGGRDLSSPRLPSAPGLPTAGKTGWAFIARAPPSATWRSRSP